MKVHIFFLTALMLCFVTQNTESVCNQEKQGTSACELHACPPGYNGVPPNCRAECLINADCPSNRTCVLSKCIDPCLGTCGKNAQCQVTNHAPICSCSSGYTGDPFLQCNLAKDSKPHAEKSVESTT